MATRATLRAARSTKPTTCACVARALQKGQLGSKASWRSSGLRLGTTVPRMKLVGKRVSSQSKITQELSGSSKGSAVESSLARRPEMPVPRRRSAMQLPQRDAMESLEDFRLETSKFERFGDDFECTPTLSMWRWRSATAAICLSASLRAMGRSGCPTSVDVLCGRGAPSSSEGESQSEPPPCTGRGEPASSSSSRRKWKAGQEPERR
mmetsp:Transcript_38148/g.103325  ORF Transcript_38148/g.103325 Transcript_38148/m.103325 type:complete len:208 (+) Transcript_38148:927-1550(+)